MSVDYDRPLIDEDDRRDVWWRIIDELEDALDIDGLPATDRGALVTLRLRALERICPDSAYVPDFVPTGWGLAEDTSRAEQRRCALTDVASAMRSRGGDLGDGDSYGRWMTRWAGVLEQRALNPIDPPPRQTPTDTEQQAERERPYALAHQPQRVEATSRRPHLRLVDKAPNNPQFDDERAVCERIAECMREQAAYLGPGHEWTGPLRDMSSEWTRKGEEL